MITNIVEDVSSLTNVSDKTLNKLLDVAIYCIGHGVHESICEQKEFAILDIGIAELHIKVDDAGIRYKFIPSKELETTITKTVVSKQSPILSKLDTELQSKIDKAYKELL